MVSKAIYRDQLYSDDSNYLQTICKDGNWLFDILSLLLR